MERFGNKKIKRERYVHNRTLKISLAEFDSGDRNNAKDGNIYSEGSGRGNNVVKVAIVMKMTCSAAPVQYEGRVNGMKAYYRSRHGGWSFEIYEGKMFASQIIYYKSGKTADKWGFSGMEQAEKRIVRYSMDYAHKKAGVKSTI